MNILFLTLSRFENINERGIYSDLARELVRRGNKVYFASPTERRYGKSTHLIEGEVPILKIRTLNIQKTNVIEKGIGMLLLEWQFDRAIRRQWPDIKFDLVLYSTPPITFNKVIRHVKNRCGCRSYLMLKDIFPQNAVDLGMIKADGPIHRMFRKKEKELYAISDRIGCMSPANCEYVIRHNSEVNPGKVELCPNATEIREPSPLTQEQRVGILTKYGLPSEKTIFIYGGNLGKPQGIDFLLDVVKANENRCDSHILIVGGGTEYPSIQNWFETNKPRNATLQCNLPPEEYNLLARACNVGLIFLDRRFTIPNFPSRLLSYLDNSMPVLLATDTHTDMGAIAEREGFGLWSEAGDLPKFLSNMDALISETKRKEMGHKGYAFMLDNYTVSHVADIISKATVHKEIK